MKLLRDRVEGQVPRAGAALRRPVRAGGDLAGAGGHAPQSGAPVVTCTAGVRATWLLYNITSSPTSSSSPDSNSPPFSLCGAFARPAARRNYFSNPPPVLHLLIAPPHYQSCHQHPLQHQTASRCCRSAVASVFKLRVNSFSCFLCRTWRPVAAHFQKFFGSAEHSRSGGRVIKTLGISLPDKRELPFQHCLVLYAAGI